MPFVKNEDVRIHYEVEGAGPALVLQHGTFGWGGDWREYGYLDKLRGARQLILVDARGHGASDKPHDPSAYELRSRVDDITSVLDACGIRQADYLGYSMGGWIGFGVAKYAPERLRSLIIIGAHPYGENMQPFRELLPKEPADFEAFVGKVWGRFLTPAIRAGLLANDLEAIAALARDRPPLSDMLPTISISCLLFVGDADHRLPHVQMCAQELANASFCSLPGCDHVASIARSDLVLPHLLAFLAKLDV
jgi:pimeloyl-ACP methyl ester carboxylesterase